MTSPNLPSSLQSILDEEESIKFVHEHTGTTRWQFASTRRTAPLNLNDSVVINGNQFPFYAQVSGYLEIPVADWVSFATSEDGDLLCVSSKTNEIAIFYHDSLEVDVVAGSFDEWRTKAVQRTHAQIHAVITVPNSILGTWAPVSSPHLSRNVVAATSRKQILLPNVWIEYDKFGRSSSTFTVLRNDPLTLEVKDEYGIFNFGVRNIGDDRLTLVGPDCEHEMVYERVAEESKRVDETGR